MATEDQDTVTPEQLDQVAAAMSSFNRAFRGLSDAARQMSLSLSSLRTAAVPRDRQDTARVTVLRGQDRDTAYARDTQDRDSADSVSFFDGIRWTGHRPRRYVSQGHP